MKICFSPGSMLAVGLIAAVMLASVCPLSLSKRCHLSVNI